MSRVLFVDDEANLLDGLRRMLHSQRKEWEMTFASSGREALEKADQTCFDLIVTDMRMPGMDGAELLRKFRHLHPQTLRIVLSGQSELESVMKVVPLAHQFLSKPCEASSLKNTVTRALKLKNLISDEPMKEIIGKVQGLPSQTRTYTAILEVLADRDVDISIVSEVIESDMAMSAKMLQLVNSSFFGLQRNVVAIDEATRFLGLSLIRDLALSIEIFRTPKGAGSDLTKFLQELQTRSTCTGIVAGSMFHDKQQAEVAFTAGMLHDIGSLLMATQFSERFAEALEVSNQSERPLHVVEQELYGVTHAEAGAYLLGLWGLPQPVMEAAAYHHRPADLPQESFNVLTAVHVASGLVEARGIQSDAPIGSTAQIDLSYLEKLGVLDRLDEWEERVDEQLADFESGAIG